ncbi:bifunctional diguanylate cyclase/phosphodiesterase [Aromatoleum anaerobium]|uniref:Diguanylate cyclase n=1 Tax=Aromatoleum anaerobium TaxID=182180 RepID=A0ABX1PKG6_9RHOO|nr:sensor domain-containing diguanylate cyclase [Aromatoleum anaerobium]MCK0505674.1 sensor domain-containing diguanylate cyclase [Aromatoleum anaerobium]
MTAARTPTIRSRLALLVTACILPASLMTAALIHYNYQRENVQLVGEVIATARALTSAVERELATTESALTVLATSPYLVSDDLAAFHRQAMQVLQTRSANNVVLADTTGRQRINTLRPFGDPLPFEGVMPQLRHVLETGRPYISGLFVGPVAHRPALSVSVPVHRGERIVYVLSMGFFPDRLSGILTEQRLPPGWTGEILDGEGIVAAHTGEMEQFIGRKGAQALTERLAEAAEGSVEILTGAGLPVISVFSRSAVSRWTTVISIPREALTNRLQQSLGWLVLGTVVLLGSSLLLAWRLGGRIAGAFSGLTGPAVALGSGQAIVVPSFRLREADEVGGALIKASAMLQQTRHKALHDELTGLANRALLDEILNNQLALSQRCDSELALLYIDLDGFKAVNDCHGHGIGDELLRVVARRINGAIRCSDVAARLGGDEFVVVMFAAGAEGAAALARKLVETLSEPYHVGEIPIGISASIGIAISSGTETTCERLLEQADAAMYRSKARGKRCYTSAPDEQDSGPPAGNEDGAACRG